MLHFNTMLLSHSYKLTIHIVQDTQIKRETIPAEGSGLWRLSSGESLQPCRPGGRLCHRSPLPPPAPTATPTQAPAQYLAVVPTVLHVDPVVLVVPQALDAQEVVILGAVAACRQRVNEKALGHLALPRQHQHPRMHTQAVQGVSFCTLCLLHRTGG